MTRALLVCPEPLGHGQPAGNGIRFVEIAKVLLADRHQVTLLSADGGPIDGCECLPTTPANLLQASERSDVAIVQGHVANDFFAHARPIPTVVDLYDPFIVENLHYFADRGAEVFTHDHATLIHSLVRGDVFLCASEAQRMFYLGLLLAVGRLNPEVFASDARLGELLRIAPFGVQPPRAPVARTSPKVLFGGIYDWYDPILAIEAVAIARKTIPEITLTFTRHPNPAITPQGKTAQAMQYVSHLGYGDFIRFEPWVAYEQRGEFLEQFSIALLTFPQSLETDLSMRTRVYDYLWAGLPIVTSSAPGTDEILTRYNAGSVVREESAEVLASHLIAMLRQRADYELGARKFVDDHQWPRVLEPLRAYVRAPRAEPTKERFAARLAVPEQPRTLIDRIKRRIGGSL